MNEDDSDDVDEDDDEDEGDVDEPLVQRYLLQAESFDEKYDIRRRISFSFLHESVAI